MMIRLQVHTRSKSIELVCFHVKQMLNRAHWFPRKVPAHTVPCFFALIFAASVGIADTATLRSVADVELREGTPSGNFGAGQSIVSGGLGANAANETRRGLIRFDPAADIPSGSTVTSVTLTVAVTHVPLTPVGSTFGLRRILQPWSETAATWMTRLDANTPWGSAGAEGADDAAAIPGSSVFIDRTGTYGFASTSNLVADVQLWVDDPSTNFGWLLISDAEDSLFTARHFGARESGTNGPTLMVEFTPPSGAVPPRLRELKLATGEISFQFDA
ncbi:MAG TPA: DNRLRE domain-containing protein, partial [Verrucomicrobiae bacterium]|nr:DNRLRE domain-containing protein [Verrucomicrobiae bacterium]